MRVESPIARVGVRRARPARNVLAWTLGAVALLLVVGGFVGLVFAGSPARIAEGVEVSGVDIGGMKPANAVQTLDARSAALAKRPVLFVAGGKSFSIRPSQLGVEADWKAAVAVAQREGEGFGPVRGFKRLHVRVFGSEVTPPVRVYDAALAYELNKIARAVDRPHADAAVRRRGLQIVVVPGHGGVRLDREEAARLISQSLASLERHGAVTLPVRSDPVKVTAPDLVAAARQARTALSAPVRLAYEDTRWRLPRWRIAELLALPSGGATKLEIGGPGADAYFERLRTAVDRKPVDARFAVTVGGIRLVPARDGLALDTDRTAAAILAAVMSPANRLAQLAVDTAPPARTTAEARTMGITGVVSSYTTTYGGTPGRLHNVQLVAQLIDDHLIKPGETFSFNGTTGERTAEKGFQEAPVIINGELQNGLGGGVCQVSTTVFNAAYEAGLRIDARTNHALYISHYPTGRDATVNYPDTDLKFTNDTGHWLLLRTFVGSGSLTVNLYGTPQNRKVESETAPLTVVGATPVERIKDPALLKGKTEIETTGSPPRTTSVQRLVYAPDGKLLHDDTWRSSYVGEPTVIHVGTKPKPKPKKPKKPPVETEPVTPPVAAVPT